MKRSRFTESRIAGILKEAPAGLPVELCCQHQLSGATHSKWKSKQDSPPLECWCLFSAKFALSSVGILQRAAFSGTFLPVYSYCSRFSEEQHSTGRLPKP